MLVGALEGIRAFQAHRPPSRRLQWNRIQFHVWPTIELTPEDLRRVVGRLAPSTAGLGIEMVQITGRVRAADGGEQERLLRIFTPAGGEAVIEVDDPPTSPLQPLDESAQRVIAARRRGLLHPAEIIKLLAPPRGRAGRGRTAGRRVRRARARGRRPARPRRPPARHEHQRHRRRAGAQLHRAPPRGDAARHPARRPDARARRARRGRVPADHGGPRSRRGAGRSARVVRALVGRPDRDGQRHRDDGLDRGRAATHRRVHAGRRRAQRHRRRHQRRRAALLQRRGDDAHAHARHPGDDAAERDGADRQARRWTTRAPCRPRTTSASAATSASWARTARRSTGRRTSPAPAACCSTTTSTPTWPRGSASRGRRSRPTRRTATCAARRIGWPARTSSASATSSRRRATPGARSPSTSAR